MRLEPEQESILRGEQGQARARALRTLVAYGEAFGAKRLLPIKSGHLAGSFGAFIFRAYYKILEQLVADGVRVKVPTTVNPRPGRDLNLINRITFRRQNFLEKSFAALGVTPNYSCVCYDRENIPGRGDILGWAESSAVQFANSVLGARTNRNSVLIDLCSALTGYTPEFGYLLDQNRRGQVLVKLQIEKMDANALGFVIGHKVVDGVPVLESYPFSRVELKNLGGAMAAAGGVALFHVEGLTPEAPDLKSVFDGEPRQTITVTQQDLDAIRTPDPGRAAMVVFGCPQMTFEEAMELAPWFAGRRVNKPVWFCMVPDSLERFRKTEPYQKVVAAGVELNTYCPLAALTVRPGKIVLTSSGKCYYYLADTIYGTREDCLKGCGVRP